MTIAGETGVSAAHRDAQIECLERASVLLNEMVTTFLSSSHRGQWRSEAAVLCSEIDAALGCAKPHDHWGMRRSAEIDDRDRLAAELAAARAEVGAAIMRERAATALNGRTVRALLMCASHCQGGHSDAGHATAELLDVPFPLTMKALAAKAKALGYDQDDLWPWYGPMVAARTSGGSDVG